MTPLKIILIRSNFPIFDLYTVHTYIYVYRNPIYGPGQHYIYTVQTMYM